MLDWKGAQSVLDLIQGRRSPAGKWTLPVMAALQAGPSRHNELRRAVDAGIAAKVFEDTVHRLVEDGLIRRHLDDTSPPAVVFALTPLGEDLLRLLAIISAWGREHGTDVSSTHDHCRPRHER